MSPYAYPVTKITDIQSYFKKRADGALIFTGKSLELRIPLRFKKHGSLIIEESITTIGVMDMIFDGQYQAGLNMLAMITIRPTDTSFFTYQGIEYLVCHLLPGDVFMTSTLVVQNQHIVYVLWDEFITHGKPIYTLDYEGLLALFEHARELTGSGIGVSRSVYEGIIAHISRDRGNIQRFYRLTKMEKPAKIIALSSISNATTSTLARLNGAYFKDEGISSALRNEVHETQPFEQLLRGSAEVITHGELDLDINQASTSEDSGRDPN